jgi:sugar lactone lactonase YvrE
MNSRTLIAIAALGLPATFAVAAPSSDSYSIERLVPASAFHGVHGLTFDANDVLYAGSVVGQAVYRVDTRNGKVETVVGAPEGMADDLVFLADGTMVWTSISAGVVRARKGNGPIRVLAKDLASINSINVRKTDGRLFAAQVFGGDGLWELDPAGVKAPRSILKDLGGFNGFDIGPDGMLYGPLWFKKQIVRIDPDSGQLKVIADGFDTPAAANFDSKGNLYALDTARGELVQIDIRTGTKRVAARLATSLDNLAIDSKDRIYVSNMADNGIQEVDPRTGTARQVVKGALAIPISIAAVSEATADTLYVADIFAFRSVDGATGRVTDIARAHAADTPIAYALAVTANDKHIVLTNTDGTVQKYDRRTRKPVTSWKGFRDAQNAIEASDGSVLVAQGGTLVRASGPDGKDRRQIASGLRGANGLALGSDTLLFVSETGAGEVSSIDLTTGARRVVKSGLDRPHGLAFANGMLIVAELGRRQLTRIDAASGASTILAKDLPIGMPGVPNASVGTATGANGAIYVSSDVENSIWKLTPKAR